MRFNEWLLSGNQRENLSCLSKFSSPLLNQNYMNHLYLLEQRNSHFQHVHWIFSPSDFLLLVTFFVDVWWKLALNSTFSKGLSLNLSARVLIGTSPISLFQGLGLYWTQPVSRMGGTRWDPPRSVFKKHIQIPPDKGIKNPLSIKCLPCCLLFCRSVMSNSFVIPWTVARQAPLSMGFLQGIFLTQGLNLHLLHWQADSLPLSHQEILSVYLLCCV